MSIRRRVVTVTVGFGLAALAVIVWAPTVGSTSISLSRAFDRSLPWADNVDAQIFFVARLPRVLAGEDQGFVAAHGLAETYAVLTVLPVTPRIGPEAAAKVIEENIVARFSVIALTAREYGRLVAGLPERGVMGGATHDVVQLACARKADAQRIYTFNVADFRRLDPSLAERVVAP